MSASNTGKQGRSNRKNERESQKDQVREWETKKEEDETKAPESTTESISSTSKSIPQSTSKPSNRPLCTPDPNESTPMKTKEITTATPLKELPDCRNGVGVCKNGTCKLRGFKHVKKTGCCCTYDE